ncbi:hypothetical protein [Kribbella sp. ALI-6-A]|uniref:hypothetical protein n=1 Tax=Kribbella sp. ALI-6-A TaxID=1933817 RepID=UPI00117A8824|nr:hypothetical protein [Kribbella sp. ALI-6-A]
MTGALLAEEEVLTSPPVDSASRGSGWGQLAVQDERRFGTSAVTWSTVWPTGITHKMVPVWFVPS